MWIARRTDYATRALLALALAPGNDPVKLQTISERTQVPSSVLEQVMLQLRNNGIVRSERGPVGGYRLNKDPSEITLEDVVRLFQGPLAPIACATRKNPEPCPMTIGCSMRDVWEEVRGRDDPRSSSGRRSPTSPSARAGRGSATWRSPIPGGLDFGSSEAKHRLVESEAKAFCTGKVAIVTGASRGIGEAIARRFAEEGAAVCVSARTEEQRDEQLPGTIHDTVRSITEAGGRAIAVRADLASAEDRERLVEEATNELGPPDILVNNAAVTWFLPTPEFPESKFRIMFEVQVRAPFELAQLVLPGMRLRKQGWILNISSGAARHPQGPPFGVRRTGTVYGMVQGGARALLDRTGGRGLRRQHRRQRAVAVARRRDARRDVPSLDPGRLRGGRAARGDGGSGARAVLGRPEAAHGQDRLQPGAAERAGRRRPGVDGVGTAGGPCASARDG